MGGRAEAGARLCRPASAAKARQIGTKFLALEQSFHGRTFGSMSTTYKAKYREPFAPGRSRRRVRALQRRRRSAREVFQRSLRHSRRSHPGRRRHSSAYAGVLRRGARAGEFHRRAARSSTRFSPAWAAPASGAPISTTAFSPTSPHWPSRSPAAFRSARCCAPKKLRA